MPVLTKPDKRKVIMNKEYALKRLKDAGYKITHLGKNIRAEKTYKTGDKENHVGRVHNVFKQVFGY